MTARDAPIAAAWGGRPAAKPARSTEWPRTQLLDFREVRKGQLIGFARIQLPIGLTIHDVAVLAGRNGPFAALPTKAQINSDGHHKRDANGKPVYIKILEWRTRELGDRFSAAVIALVRAVHPEAFAGEAG